MVTFGMRRGLFGSGVALLALVVGSSAVQADPLLYTITGIAPLLGTAQSIATAINNNGQVAGVSYNTVTDNTASYGGLYGSGTKYFLSSGGQTSQIGTSNGYPPNSINDSGQVVGGNSWINNAGYVQNFGTYVANPDGSYLEGFGYRVSDSTMPVSMGANQINNLGLVVGLAGSPGGVMVYVPPGATWAEAALIMHPISYHAEDGGTLYTNFAGGVGVGINDRGELLIQNSPIASTYVLDESGHLTSLSTLPGGAGFLGGSINNSGQVVGSQLNVGLDGSPTMDSTGSYNYLKAELYTNGKIVDLNSLLGPGSGWDLTRATGINDLGQIIGQGTYDG